MNFQSMTQPLLCSYSDQEEFTWYVDTYDFQATLFNAKTRAKCRFCGSEMSDWSDERQDYFLEACANCGFWKAVELSGIGGFRNGEAQPARRGVAKFYDVSAIEAPVADLRRYLTKNPEHLAHVNPFVFEELVADCMQSAFSGCEVIKVGGRRDRGIDLILIQTTGENYLVQVKRRSNIEKSEGVQVVRELNGVLFREGIAKGLVVTTARNYSPDATEETWVATPRGEEGAWQSIELFGFDDIVDWLSLRPKTPYEPWSQFTRGVDMSAVPLKLDRF